MKPQLKDWVDFIRKVGEDRWVLAGTVTLHKSHPKTKKKLHPNDANTTAGSLLTSINKRLFNHRAARHGTTVSSAMLLGYDAYRELSHLHFVLGTPYDISYDQLACAVEKSIQKASWCNEEYRLDAYKDAGWLRYMLNHGTAYLMDQYLFKAKS